MALFLLGGVAFSALSPTGYLPTLLAGALFPWWLAWPLAYTVANLGALCNLVLVRGPCHPLARRVVAGHARLQKASGFGGFGWLDAELRREGEGAYRVVALVRLPGLWSGLFNYIFALSSVRGKAYILGNLLGMAPGRPKLLITPIFRDFSDFFPFFPGILAVLPGFLASRR